MDQTKSDYEVIVMGLYSECKGVWSRRVDVLMEIKDGEGAIRVKPTLLRRAGMKAESKNRRKINILQSFTIKLWR